MSRWNDSTDKQLLLSIIHLTAPALPKWDQVATMMGDGFTAESVRQHFQKLRKECKDKYGEPADAVTTGATPKATPRKPKATPRKDTPVKSTGKGKGKGKRAAEVDEDDEEGASPSKKMAVKAEESGDDP